MKGGGMREGDAHNSWAGKWIDRDGVDGAMNESHPEINNGQKSVVSQLQ